MTTDTKLKELIINKLTTSQYDSIEEKDPNQLYIVTDGPGIDDAVLKYGDQEIDGTKTFKIAPEAPTPEISDNSTKIATTAWFNQKIQVVSTLPANPDSNVYYFVTGE